FLFQGKSQPTFEEKLSQKFEIIFSKRELPFGVDLFIETENTFPHSSGIASSASSMAAVAKMFSEIYSITNASEFSSLAREFSGSASRSVGHGWSLWGETPLFSGSNQYFAI